MTITTNLAGRELDRRRRARSSYPPGIVGALLSSTTRSAAATGAERPPTTKPRRSTPRGRESTHHLPSSTIVVPISPRLESPQVKPLRARARATCGRPPSNSAALCRRILIEQSIGLAIGAHASLQASVRANVTHSSAAALPFSTRLPDSAADRPPAARAPPRGSCIRVCRDSDSRTLEPRGRIDAITVRRVVETVSALPTLPTTAAARVHSDRA